MLRARVCYVALSISAFRYFRESLTLSPFSLLPFDNLALTAARSVLAGAHLKKKPALVAGAERQGGELCLG